MDERAIRLVADERRRRVLRTLRETGGVSRTDLVRRIGGPDEPTRRIRARLYHVHLPKLEDANAIEWDRDDERVRPGEAFDDLLELTQAVEDKATPLPAQ